MAVTHSPSTSAALSPFHDEMEGSPSDDLQGSSGNSYIEKSILLDIAFLHSIATHRPIGPHKHFNVIPILINLDRTARQVGARIRDDGYSRDASGDRDTEETASQSIKREDDGAEDGDASTSPFSSIPVDSDMIWERLHQLYNVSGLEELENQAIDNDVYSPFRNVHAVQQRRSSVQTLDRVPSPFGFGSGLGKRKKQQPPKASRSNSKRSAAAASTTVEDEEEGKESFSDHVEFQLGPWEEYESLIAPRRLKEYAPEEDEQSESDEELSEPSEIEAEGEAGEGPEDDALSEGDEGDDTVDGEEDGVGEEDDEEDDDEDEEEEGDTSTTSRRKSTSKKPTSSKKQKKTTSSVNSRGTRNSTKPRRSSRR